MKPVQYAFLPCGHLNFKSVVIAQNDDSIRAVLMARFKTNTKETQYLASTHIDKLVQCSCRNINCAQGKRSIHARWNFISRSLSLHGYGDERWPTEATSNKYSAVSYWVDELPGLQVRQWLGFWPDVTRQVAMITRGPQYWGINPGFWGHANPPLGWVWGLGLRRVGVTSKGGMGGYVPRILVWSIM